MKKIFVVMGIVVLFLGACVIPAIPAVNIQKNLATTGKQNILNVDDDGNEHTTADFNKIQDAIDNANSGDEIRVYAGNYAENVVVDKRLDIIGGWNGTSTIDGGGNGNVVKIISAANNVKIEKFTIKNSGNYNVGKVFDAGIHVLSSLNIITGNTISDNLGDGIYLSKSAGNEISNNVIINNSFDGIGLFSIISGGNTISENTIQDNGKDGISMLQGHSNLIRKNNITGNKESGVHLKRSRLNKIEKNYIGNSDIHGIYFEFLCIGNSITLNNISVNADKGILFKFQCDLNTIILNNFFKNDGNRSIFQTSHVSFLSCFLNGWRENYWDDYNPIIPNWWYLIWGRWGFVPWPNFDLYPVSTPYPWPPM